MRKQREQKEVQESRLNTAISILPTLQRELMDQARREDKSASRLIEVLCRWALDQMNEHQISSYELKMWHAVPPPTSRYFKAK